MSYRIPRYGTVKNLHDAYGFRLSGFAFHPSGLI